MTTRAEGLPVSAAICCAAASVSKLVLFHLPSRCSVMTRIFIYGSIRQFKRVAKNYQITRASYFSFSTSLAATSFGVPVRNSVFFVFVGT